MASRDCVSLTRMKFVCVSRTSKGSRLWMFLRRESSPRPHADGLSLGVHFTKTLWGTFLLGPTATYVEGKDNYEKNRLPIADFAHSAKSLLPEIEEKDLQLGYSGLRPKLVPPDHKGIVDFVITRDPKVPQAIHLVDMESPGLTAAPAVAEHVAEMVGEILK